MPYKTPLTFTYDSGRFEENMNRAMKLGDWAGFPARRQESALFSMRTSTLGAARSSRITSTSGTRPTIS